MSGKRSRTKGHNFERYCANFFRLLGFNKARRNLTETQFGQGIDLVETGVFDVQCKAYQQYSPISKINEVPKQKGRIAILITKGDKKEPMLVMRLNDFKTIFNKGIQHAS